MINEDLFKCIDCKIPVPANKIICVSCLHKKNFPAETRQKPSEKTIERDLPMTIAHDTYDQKSVFILSETELDFNDYSFEKTTVTFKFVLMDFPEIESSEVAIEKWRFDQISDNGFDRFSAGKNNPMVIMVDYDNLTVGRIAKIAAIISRGDVEKVADFLHIQKMEITEKEICALMGEIDFEDKGFYDELK